jgi:hypothetical protein
VAEEGIPFRDIAESIGRVLGVPTKSVSAEDVGADLGFLATLAQLDDPTSNVRTREQLGWRPTHPRSSRTSQRYPEEQRGRAVQSPGYV